MDAESKGLCLTLLPVEKWATFLARWSRALERLDSSASFLETAQYNIVERTVHGERCAFVEYTSANHARRRELAKQRKPYQARSLRVANGLYLAPRECGLCDSVLRALDDPEGAIALAERDNYLLVPNCFPAHIGACLLVPKSHDDHRYRVDPTESKPGKVHYLPMPGKTIGSILSDEMLRVTVELADKQHMVAMRNHVLDGMSLPQHDHWHLYPEDTQFGIALREIVQHSIPSMFSPALRFLSKTPFDTLMIKGMRKDGVRGMAQLILERLERDNQVFTVIYHGDVLLVTPRNRQHIAGMPTKLGGCVSSHCIDAGEEFRLLAERLIPKRGTFAWDEYLADLKAKTGVA